MSFASAAAWLLALLALILALLLAWYVLRLARRRALARAAGTAPEADAGPAAVAAGIAPAVRAAFAGREEEGSPAYQVPLVLLLGAAGAARSAVEAADERRAEAAPLRWHATPQGWVLYADMAAFGFDGEDGSEGWHALAEELERRRPRRPLDGVLLALPVHALGGVQAWPPLELERRAAQARRRLGELQRLFGLRLPVYLLITHCEQLDGFASFAAALPDGLRQAMLGWSNPHDPEQAFSAAWMGDAFGELGRVIADVQAEVAAAGGAIDDSDAYFLLPGAVARLATPAAAYAGRLLGDDAHSVAPMLRGVYLCGDQGEATGSGPARPWFAGDLLARKVFPERGLARPLSGQLFSRNKSVRRWAGACGVLLLVWGGALVWGHWRLRVQAERLADTLDSIAQEQERRTIDRARQGHLDYRVYQAASQKILDAMMLSQGSLAQIAIPASWRWTGQQDLDARVEAQFGQGLANIVYRTLDKGLNRLTAAQTGAALQAGTLELSDKLACQIGASHDQADFAPGAVLADTLPFKRLERFVADAGEFEQARKHLDNLHHQRHGGMRDLVKVAAYTDAFDLPAAETMGPSPMLQRALSNNYPPDNAAQQRERQRKSMLCAFHEQHHQFLASLIDRHPARAAARTVAEQLRGGSALANAEREQSLIPALQQLALWLKAPTVHWLDQAESGEGKAYGELLRKVQANTLLGPDAADWARKRRDEHAKALQDELVNPGGGAHAVLERNGDGKLALTPELANLQAGLERLMRQDFMSQAASPAALAFQGLGPLWDVKQLNLALLQAGEARSYLDKELPGFPRPFQPELRRYTDQRLADSLLAGAAAGLPAGTQAAETYQRLGQSQKLLTALLDALSTLDAGVQHGALAAAIAAQAEGGLRWLERELVEGGLYQPRDGGFDWWQGTPNPAAQGFAGGDAQALEDYLAAQQARVESAVRQAQPLLRLLEAAQGNLTGAQGRRWSEIAAELARFQEKQPNARMAQLHSFIRNDLAAVDGRKCLAGTAAHGGGTDLFSERRRALAGALAKRCAALGMADADQDYQALREQFRRTLAGRFPFADAARNGEAAELDDVLAYLQLYDRLAPDAQGMAPGRARDFVAATAAVRQFLGPLLPAAEGADGAGYQLAVRFRVGSSGEADGDNALAGEIGGNRIVAWTLQSGDDSIAWDSSAKGAVQYLGWRPGMPLVLSLRWADNVAELPVDDGADRYLKVSGRQAVYRFSEPWSLLRMLARHAQQPTAPARPATLRFELPTAGGGPRVRVFLRLAVMPAQKKEILGFPAFPAAAPGDEPLRLIARP
jgi:type VI secretion system protein ImpL